MQEQRPDDLDGNTFFLYCDIKPLRYFQARFFGGGGGIRTYGAIANTQVFKSSWVQVILINLLFFKEQ